MTDSYQEKVVLFCPYCGTRLDEGAKFCRNCGQSIGNPDQRSTETNGGAKTTEQQSWGNPAERKTVYQGYIHKCPNCGEVLESFVSNCSSCGYEIRDTKSANSVKEFTLKLEKVEAQKMPPFQEKKSIMRTVFGRDFDDKDDAEEARKKFEEQKQQEKVNLIINYSVPNTKEDILEFMLLASSNIDVKYELNDDVTKAWVLKLDQVYQKAEISIKGEADLLRIRSIYEKKQQQIKDKKIKTSLAIALPLTGLFSLSLFMAGMEWNPAATIIITILIVSAVISGIVLFGKKK
jgi:hypothetical protein